jgi:pimeloyl-ACP methyl ester carboxylesterase
MRSHGEDLRGAGRLAVAATRGVLDVVEAMHRTIAGGPPLLGQPLAGPARLMTGIVYGGIRGATDLVGAGLDAALAQLSPLLGDSVPGPERGAILAALNGVLGDYLHESGNPLALQMAFCRGGQALDLTPAALRAALPEATGRLVVCLHGSSMGDQQWNRRGHDHGAALARDRGGTALYLRYNSGRHISTNGRELAALLERLVAAWPGSVDELVLVGHSMGGLVARSACLLAEEAGHAWRTRLRALVCLGSPHHGAPLERGGSWVDLLLGVSAYTAPIGRLGRLRSAGITDLRHGNVRDEDWDGRDRFAHRADVRTPLPLPADVRCYAVAATRSRAPGRRLKTDGLVPVDSALGRHARPELTLAFPAEHQLVAHGAGHLDLLGGGEVYERLRAWLT